MGTHRSRHNKGRKPFYKDHRHVAATLLEKPFFNNRGFYNTQTHWKPVEKFKLDILCEADADVERSAEALGRSPTSICHYARDLGLTLPTQWSRLILPKRKTTKFRIKEAPRQYPYIITPRDEHADILAVNAIIPRGIPDNMRADICQEIMVAILEGRTTLEMLRARSQSATYFIKKFFHDNYEQGGHAISFQDTDDDWDSDAVASSVASKEWHREQFAERRRYYDSATRTYTAPVQFEAAWQDQIGRTRMELHELGQFLTHEEVEEMLDRLSECPAPAQEGK